MNTRQKVNLISLVILLICLLAAILIYQYTGNVVVTIFIAQPIIHWILKKRSNSERY